MHPQLLKNDRTSAATSLVTTAARPTGPLWNVPDGQSGTRGKEYPGVTFATTMLKIGGPFAPFYKDLTTIELELQNWIYDCQAPNGVSLDEGRAMLDRLRSNGILPYRITPSAVGGIGICMRSAERYADIECDNDGLLSVVISDGKGQVDAFEVDPTFAGRTLALTRISTFLHGQ